VRLILIVKTNYNHYWRQKAWSAITLVWLHQYSATCDAYQVHEIDMCAVVWIQYAINNPINLSDIHNFIHNSLCTERGNCLLIQLLKVNMTKKPRSLYWSLMADLQNEDEIALKLKNCCKEIIVKPLKYNCNDYTVFLF